MCALFSTSRLAEILICQSRERRAGPTVTAVLSACRTGSWIDLCTKTLSMVQIVLQLSIGPFVEHLMCPWFLVNPLPVGVDRPPLQQHNTSLIVTVSSEFHHDARSSPRTQLAVGLYWLFLRPDSRPRAVCFHARRETRAEWSPWSRPPVQGSFRPAAGQGPGIQQVAGAARSSWAYSQPGRSLEPPPVTTALLLSAARARLPLANFRWVDSLERLP